MTLSRVPLKQLDTKVVSEDEGVSSIILIGQTCEVGTTENDLMFVQASGVWKQGLVGGATVEEARVLGIAKNVSGTSCDIATTGVVDGFTSRAIGSPQYLDKTTPGAVVETKPSVPGGGFVFMGVALTATKIVINIEHVGFT